MGSLWAVGRSGKGDYEEAYETIFRDDDHIHSLNCGDNLTKYICQYYETTYFKSVEFYFMSTITS